MTEGNRRTQEPVTVTDKRRIDPETGEVRHVPPGAAAGRGGAGGIRGRNSARRPARSPNCSADLQRVQADFANYRKRALRDQQAAADRAKAAVVSQLLGVLDDLDRARKHGDLESGPLKSVADKLTSALTGLGLTAFGAEGEDFDPALHEAVQHEGDGEGSKPVIGTVMRQGYKLGDQVLRHALVGVVDTVGDGERPTRRWRSRQRARRTGDNADTRRSGHRIKTRNRADNNNEKGEGGDAAWPNVNGSKRTSTRSWASPPTPAQRRSSAPTASWLARTASGPQPRQPGRRRTVQGGVRGQQRVVGRGQAQGVRRNPPAVRRRWLGRPPVRRRRLRRLRRRR